MINKKIGFIGIGNMGYSILKGIVKSGKVSPENIIVSAKSKKTLDKAKEDLNIKGTLSNKDLAKKSDIIFLGVKPNIHSYILKEIKDGIKEDAIIVSMAAGITLENMEEILGKARLVKIMLNIGALVNMSMTAMSHLNLNSSEKNKIKSLLETFGLVSDISEDLMDSFSGISGCSPAFAFMFIEAMADSAVLHGMDRESAYTYSAQALKGAAELVIKTEMHPGALKDMVTSPGGSTIEGVVSLEENGFRNAVIKAVDTSINKSKKMTKKS